MTPGVCRANDRVHVRESRAGDALDLVSATFPAATVDDAYRLSGELAAYWGLSGEPLEAWYREDGRGWLPDGGSTTSG